MHCWCTVHLYCALIYPYSSHHILSVVFFTCESFHVLLQYVSWYATATRMFLPFLNCLITVSYFGALLLKIMLQKLDLDFCI